jgi:transposase-like protein
MAVFRWRHFAGEIILLCVRWYCRYGISYRELEEMMGERGVAVDHTTVYRWTQRYAPELEKRSAWYRSRLSFSWRVDETYVRVKGRWKYLYRAIDKGGATLDFYLADRRNAKPRPPSASLLPPCGAAGSGSRGSSTPTRTRPTARRSPS